MYRKTPNSTEDQSSNSNEGQEANGGSLGYPSANGPTCEDLTHPSSTDGPSDAEIKALLGIDPTDPNVIVHRIAAGSGGFADFAKEIGGIVDDLTERLGHRQVVSEEDEAVMEVCFEVVTEVIRARKKHAPMHSPHEGHSVLLEEVEELWDEIKADRGRQLSARTEAIHVAAMAVRYILDIDPK